MLSSLSVEKSGRVAVVTLARLNAALDEVTADENVSVLHIRSNQKAFCAGADLALMRSCFSTPDGPEVMLEVARSMQRVFARIETAPVVTILRSVERPWAAGWNWRWLAICVLRQRRPS